MTDIADKIYAATGLTLNAEAAAKVGQMIQAENEKLRATRKWNIERDGEDLLICEGDHEKHEVCAAQRWVKADTLKAELDQAVGCIEDANAEREQLQAENAQLREALTEVMVWINEWEPAFIQDGEWRETKRMVRAALGEKE